MNLDQTRNGDLFTQQEDNIENRFHEFCIYFTNNFVKGLLIYNCESIGNVAKAGQIGGNFGYVGQILFSLIGAGVGHHITGSETGTLGGAKVFASFGGSLTGIVGKYFGEKNHKLKAKKVSNIFGNFVISEDKIIQDLRYQLVECAVHIFKNYEYQIRYIECKYGWKLALHKIALDAVDRIFNYSNDHYNEISKPADYKELSHLIYTGLLKGSSKKGILSYITKESMQGKKIPLTKKLFPHSGRTVQRGEEKWSTHELWIMPGIVHEHQFYTCSNSDHIKYGFRIPFQFEILQQDSFLNNYHIEISIDEDSLNYTYFIYNKSSADIQADIEQICHQLMPWEQKLQNHIDKQTKLVEENQARIRKIEKMLEKREEPNKMLPQLDKWVNKHIIAKQFVPRYYAGQSILEILQQKLQDIGIYVITGLGGVGKSTLAKWYAESHEDDYEHIIWMDSDEKILSQSVRVFSEKLKINNDDKNLENIVVEIYENLKNKKCLFIFDFAEDYASLINLLPNRNLFPNIHSLITSRYSTWNEGTDKMPTFNLNVFTDDEAKNFIIGHNALGLDTSEHDAEKLAEKLQCLPLALRQAVAYIKMINSIAFEYGISNYLRDFDYKAKALLDFPCRYPANNSRERLSDYDKTVFTTWQITIDKISQDPYAGQLAISFLDIISYIAPDGISIHFFDSLGKRSDIAQALYLLKQYSMIQLSSETRTFDVHRLVQHVVRINNQENELETLKKTLQCLEYSQRDGNFLNHVTTVFLYSYKYRELCMEHGDLVDVSVNFMPLELKQKAEKELIDQGLEIDNYHILRLVNNGQFSQTKK